MKYKRMPIEIESPEEGGYNQIKHNLAESSVRDIVFGDLELDLSTTKLEYSSHRGHEGLRERLATQEGIKTNDILTTQGAIGALFMINTALLTPSDHLIVVHPNYATNTKVPEAIGCEIGKIRLSFDHQWKLDVQEIADAIKPNTKLISITSPHNPSGASMNMSQVQELIRLVDQTGITLLADETYRNMYIPSKYPLLSSLSDNIISVSSFSKIYGLPGLRVGRLATQNAKLYETLLAAKEMSALCNAVLNEEIAYQFLLQNDEFERKIHARTDANFKTLQEWLSHETRLECVKPDGGVVCFPRFCHNSDIDSRHFYKTLAAKGTAVGPGHWFELSDRYMRIGFGWEENEVFTAGLRTISEAINESVR